MKLATIIIGACTTPSNTEVESALAADHFHPKGKVPSEHILKVFEEAKANLPFSDTRDLRTKKSYESRKKARKNILSKTTYNQQTVS